MYDIRSIERLQVFYKTPIKVARNELFPVVAAPRLPFEIYNTGYMKQDIGALRYRAELVIERDKVELAFQAWLYSCSYGIHVTKSSDSRITD